MFELTIIQKAQQMSLLFVDLLPTCPYSVYSLQSREFSNIQVTGMQCFRHLESTYVNQIKW